MKKILSAVLAIVMLCGMVTTPAGAEGITVTLNGNKIAFDQPPIIKDDRTLVPVRAIFEELGAEVGWNGDTQTVTAVKGDTVIGLTIGDYAIYKNGYRKSIDVPAILVNNRVLVPVRAISEAFDCDVLWDGNTSTVVITKSGYNYPAIDTFIDRYTSGNDIVAIFGEPDSKDDMRQEWYTGYYYQHWTYDNFGMKFRMCCETPYDEQYVVSCSIFDNSFLKLSSGIGIGSRKEDFLKIYDDFFVNNSWYQFPDGWGNEISFKVENGYVTMIYVGEVAE